MGGNKGYISVIRSEKIISNASFLPKDDGPYQWACSSNCSDGITDQLSGLPENRDPSQTREPTQTESIPAGPFCSEGASNAEKQSINLYNQSTIQSMVLSSILQEITTTIRSSTDNTSQLGAT